MSTPVWKGLHRLWYLIPTKRQYGGDYVHVKYPEHPYAWKSGRVALHRIIMENHLGRYLDPKEIVHHRDLNKINNRIENLELCKDHADHLRKHIDQGTSGFTKAVEWPPDDEMFELLDQMSIGAVARHLSIHRSTITCWCHRHDFKIKPRSYWPMQRDKELRPSKEKLEKLVWEMPVYKFAKLLGVTSRTALRWCRDLAVMLPPHGYWRRKTLPEREEFRQLLDQSIVSTATHYDVSVDTIKRWAKRLKLSWDSSPGKLRPIHVDENLFQRCYTQVTDHQIYVRQAEQMLGLPVSGFARECRKRGIVYPGSRMPRSVAAQNTQCSVERLAEVAAQVWRGELTYRAAGDAVGCSDYAFRKRCHNHNIDLPFGGVGKSRAKPVPPRKELLALLDDGFTYAKIAKKYGVSYSTFRKWQRRYDLPASHKFASRPKPSRSELKSLLWKYPVAKIAQQFGFADASVQYWIRRYNITDIPPRGHWSKLENKVR